MMPPYCPESAPPGEHLVYVTLQRSDDAEDWIVLHSLAIADHFRQVEGEADFVIVVPNAGVVVIEVKSHYTVDRLPDGRWKLGSNPPVARGPFQQVREALHSIRDFLKKKGVDLRGVPMVSAVWFTLVRARTMLPATPEWHDWQVLDSEDLKHGTASAVLRTLAAGTKHLDRKIQYFSYGGTGPAPDTTERIVSLLRPRFEVARAAATRAAPGNRR
ncbi:nuclease-related domain-containing protein [Phytomonospora sp. NPDC050363]|uniref:nuclease-related domain-containing protein n=1 Tax=Phytomonospora sp. NPDC050363 TaxID=3155642 RepID=UPI0033D04B0C